MIANVIVDIILVLFMLIGIVVGIKKGFIRAVARPIKGILALVLAIATASPVGNGIIKPWLLGPITGQISSYLNEKCANITEATAAESMPTLIKMAAGLCNIDISEAASGESSGAVIESVVNAVADPVVGIISVIIAFIVMRIIFGILLSVAVAILSSLFDRGIIGVLNRVLGCVFTFAMSFFVCWVLCAVFDFVIKLPALAEYEWATQFTGGYVYGVFKLINPIDLLLSF